MEIILMVFPKKILFRANGPFRTQNGESSQLSLYSPSGLFYNFTQWKGPREMWKLFFVKKILFRAIWLFWLQNGMPS